MIIIYLFLVLVLSTVSSTSSLQCYSCNCRSVDVGACDCDTLVTVQDGGHCTITKEFGETVSLLELSHSFSNSPDVRIKDPFYVFVDETIFYSEATKTWQNKTNRIIFGCDWDLCNKYDLIENLPKQFQLYADENWLDKNIYANGRIDGCYDCKLDYSDDARTPVLDKQCSYTSCSKPSTCALHALWNDAATNQISHQSACTSSELRSDSTGEKYQLRIEAIVYLAKDRSTFDIWQLDINCAGDNCNRPTMFQEVKDHVRGVVSDSPKCRSKRLATTTVVPATTADVPEHRLYCYDCLCTSSTSCTCSKTELDDSDKVYCSITRRQNGQNVTIEFGHININSTYYQVREYPYVLLEESIIYNDVSGRWITQPDTIVYGCNWNLCNKPDFLPYLSSSFQMRVSESWLNTSILGSGLPARDCHVCTDKLSCSNSGFINDTVCPITTCNGTCIVVDVFDDPTHTHQCYNSTCAPEGSSADTHRVDLHGILYASNTSNVEIWEITAYCRADNCSRAEIFQEIRDNIAVYPGDLSVLFNKTGEASKLRCRDCTCPSAEDCECKSVSTNYAASTYCTIEAFYTTNTTNFVFSFIENYSNYISIDDVPFVTAQKSIVYNNSTHSWNGKTTKVTFGCNWNYCNNPSLLSLLSSSLEINVQEAWLNATILGTGEPAKNCHDCSGNQTCSSSGSLYGGSCNYLPCNATCFASKTIGESDSNEYCYTASCGPLEIDESSSSDVVGVTIEGIVYARNQSTLKLLDIQVSCRTDNCSHPEIFQEIQNAVSFQTGNLSAIFDEESGSEPGLLKCYQCSCFNNPDCACNETTVVSTSGSYCTIFRHMDGQSVFLYLEPIDINSTKVHISRFPFMIVEDSILYDENTGVWNTIPSEIMYGCNWDYCNDPLLIQYLPITFHMRVSEEWLNETILTNGSATTNCHECRNASQCGTSGFTDISRCPPHDCNTTCRVSDTFVDSSVDVLCYQSYCLPSDYDSEYLSGHRIDIGGIIYGNTSNSSLEIWEIDIYCRAPDCSRQEIFQELQSHLTAEFSDLSKFGITAPSITTPTTTKATTKTSTTVSSSSTTTTTKTSTAVSSSSTTTTTTTKTSTTVSSSSTTTTKTSTTVSSSSTTTKTSTTVSSPSTTTTTTTTTTMTTTTTTKASDEPAPGQAASFKISLAMIILINIMIFILKQA